MPVESITDEKKQTVLNTIFLKQPRKWIKADIDPNVSVNWIVNQIEWSNLFLLYMLLDDIIKHAVVGRSIIQVSSKNLYLVWVKVSCFDTNSCNDHDIYVEKMCFNRSCLKMLQNNLINHILFILIVLINVQQYIEVLR